MIIAVDFDGTLADYRYPKIGEPTPHAVEVLRGFAALIEERPPQAAPEPGADEAGGIKAAQAAEALQDAYSKAGIEKDLKRCRRQIDKAGTDGRLPNHLDEVEERVYDEDHLRKFIRDAVRRGR